MNIEQISNRIDPQRAAQNMQQRSTAAKDAAGSSFSEVLNREHTLQFSGHALKRMQSRSIAMNHQDMKRLEEAVSRAEQKGSKDSLVMDGDRAFLVNIPNKKVITAVDMMELRDKVFTQIDSTVLTHKNINS